MNEVMTTSQAVRAFDMHPITVLRLIQMRKVAAKKDANGRWLIRRADLEAWSRKRILKASQRTAAISS